MVTDEMVYTTVNFFNKFQMFAQKLHSPYFLNLILVSLRVVFFFKLGFTPCKAGQPLQDMELQEKEAKTD